MFIIAIHDVLQIMGEVSKTCFQLILLNIKFTCNCYKMILIILKNCYVKDLEKRAEMITQISLMLPTLR